MKDGDGGCRILLVDDFNLCRIFFAEGLRQNPGFEVFEAATAEEALTQAERLSPEVVLLNISMRHCSGMALLQFIHRQFPDIGLLAFSYLHHDHLYAERAICAGASGYISVDESGGNLLKAVEQISAGDVYLSPPLRKKLCADSGFNTREKESPFERLSHREFEVFCLTGHGHVPKRIAELLKVSVKTVETYRERIREKLGLMDGGELLYHATGFIREQSLPSARGASGG
jgi:DNA-binding NarL/FixJ family response regulator